MKSTTKQCEVMLDNDFYQIKNSVTFSFTMAYNGIVNKFIKYILF